LIIEKIPSVITPERKLTQLMIVEIITNEKVSEDLLAT